jgi:hypothetical protein
VFCLISYGSLVSKLRSYYAFYTKICLSLPISSGGVAETHQYKDPLSGTDNEVSGERDVVDGPWSNGLAPFGYYRMCDLFSIHSTF